METPFPLDLATTAYSYIERPNRFTDSLMRESILHKHPGARILDVGCGCGANARAFHKISSAAHVTGIEPNPRAAELAQSACDVVFQGMLDAWLAKPSSASFDAVVLSDVLEHVADPIEFLRSLTQAPAVKGATWIISVPNYGVWYNRMRTLFGRFE